MYTCCTACGTSSWIAKYAGAYLTCGLQRRGLSLNPITTMYYIAPASLAFLSIPWFFIEARQLMNDPKVCLSAPLEALLGQWIHSRQEPWYDCLTPSPVCKSDSMVLAYGSCFEGGERI